MGHKSLRGPEVCTNVEQALFELGNCEFTVKLTERADEVKASLEAGFEYSCIDKDGLMFFRYRR